MLLALVLVTFEGPAVPELEEQLCGRIACSAAAEVTLSLRVVGRQLAVRLTAPEGLLITDTYPLRADGLLSAWAARDLCERVVTALNPIPRRIRCAVSPSLP